MAITPMDIQNQQFSEARRGYDGEEVDTFLDRIALEIEQMLAQIAELESAVDMKDQQLVSAAQQIQAAEEEKAKSAAQIEQLKAEVQTCAQKAQAAAPVVQPAAPASDNDVTPETIAAAFIQAQRSAEAIQDEARQKGERTYREAEAKSREIIRDALAEKQHLIEEIDSLVEVRDSFRSEYKLLISRFGELGEQIPTYVPNGYEPAAASAPVEKPVQEEAADEAEPEVGFDVEQYSAPTTPTFDDSIFAPKPAEVFAQDMEDDDIEEID